jgi:hypothetical protein
MSSRAVLLLFSALVAFVPRGGAVERIVERTFAVQPGCTVAVDTYRGSITVEEGDSPEVRLYVHLENGNLDEKRVGGVLEALQLEINAADNAVSVRTRNPRETRVRFVWNDQDQIELVYKLVVPRQCSVDLRTLNGSITVGSLAGRMIARAETGSIFFRRIEGSINASTETGDLVVSRCSGDVTFRVMKGSISAGLIGGHADFRTASGDIEIQTAVGGVSASAEAGDLTVGFARVLTEGSNLKTSGGSISARIDPETNCAVDASSVWGRVQSTLPIVAAPDFACERRARENRVVAAGFPMSRRAAEGNFSYGTPAASA